MNSHQDKVQDQVSHLLIILQSLLETFSKPNSELHALIKGTTKKVEDISNEQPIHLEENQIPILLNGPTSSQKRLTSHQRLQIAIRATLEQNNVTIAKEFNVSEGTVRKCLKKYQEDEEYLKSVEVVRGNAKRKPPRRVPKFPETEAKLLEWIIEQRLEKLSVTMKDIQRKSLEIHSTLPSESQEPFSASRGWFLRFIARNNLSRRTPTHVMQQLREGVVEDIKMFWQEIIKLRTKIEILREIKDVERVIFLNIDEVPIFLDMSPTRTYHAKGARMVEVKRSKGGKMLSTALLAVFSTGLKLPIYWVSKGSTDVDIDEDLKPYIISRSGNSGWMDTILFKDWIKRLFTNLILPEKTHLILILDRARIHSAEEVLSKINMKVNSSHFFIPSGCTFLLQPLDVGINKPFKDKIRERFNQWFKDEGSKENNKTPAGYFRPPPL